MITNEEAKQLMLELLLRTKTYCEENNIGFFLDSGTLLGAIRHKGFIPWDDDVDICMLRDDYDKFCLLTRTKPIAEFIDIYREEDGLFPYIKIVDKRTELIEYPDTLRLKLGIYIDVFPKDGHPKSERLTTLHCKWAQFWTNCYWFNKYSVKVWRRDSSWLRRAIATVLFPLVKDSTLPLKKAIKIAKKYSINNDGYCSSILAGGIRGRVPVKCFDATVYVDFEGHKMPAPVGYDQYLKKLYEKINGGDYMSLPPIEQRCAAHDTEIYWRENKESE